MRRDLLSLRGHQPHRPDLLGNQHATIGQDGNPPGQFKSPDGGHREGHAGFGLLVARIDLRPGGHGRRGRRQGKKQRRSYAFHRDVSLCEAPDLARDGPLIFLSSRDRCHRDSTPAAREPNNPPPAKYILYIETTDRGKDASATERPCRTSARGIPPPPGALTQARPSPAQPSRVNWFVRMPRSHSTWIVSGGVHVGSEFVAQGGLVTVAVDARTGENRQCRMGRVSGQAWYVPSISPSRMTYGEF